MDYKSLLSQVEKTVEAIDASAETATTISKIAATIATNFKELGIAGGRLYASQGDYYELVERFGQLGHRRLHLAA